MPARISQRVSIGFLLLIWSALSIFSQSVGSTEQEVLLHYGAPQIEREQSGGKKLWIYSNGTRLVLANGIVVESNISASQPAPQPNTAPRYTPPSQPRPVEQAKPKAQSAQTDTVPRRKTGASISGMDGLALFIVVVGLIIGTVGGIWLIIISFQTSILWGFGCLFVPLVSLVFIIVHWREAKGAFVLNAVGALIAMLGALVGAVRA